MVEVAASREVFTPTSHEDRKTFVLKYKRCPVRSIAMTRRDWWLGIGIILLALLIQTFILIRVNRPNESTPRARPLSASNAAAHTLAHVN